MAFDLGQLSASFRLSSSSRQLALIRASLKDYLYVKFVYVWPNFWDRFCLYTLLYIRRKYVIITENVPRTSSITVLPQQWGWPIRAVFLIEKNVKKWDGNFCWAVFDDENSNFLLKTIQKVFQKFVGKVAGSFLKSCLVFELEILSLLVVSLQFRPFKMHHWQWSIVLFQGVVLRMNGHFHIIIYII